jgi:MOSC domain-containing protein YiiM
MITGKVEGIFIAANPGEPTVFVGQAHAIPGMGIEGDRYFRQPGIDNSQQKPGREITLVEMEAIEAMQVEDGIKITPDQTRRNIITRGVSLNDLVGRVFYIGSIQLRGVRLCQPCQYLANRTDQRILRSMTQRGGLRAEILSEGIIHLNDEITIAE